MGDPSTSGASFVTSHLANHHHSNQVLLATAVVNATDSWGRPQKCRVLLDNGGEATFITEACVQRLGLHRRPTTVDVRGVGNSSAGYSRGVVSLQIVAVTEDFKINIDALVLKQLSSRLPRCSFDVGDWTCINQFLRSTNQTILTLLLEWIITMTLCVTKHSNFKEHP